MPKKKQSPKWPDRDEWMTVEEALAFANSRLPKPVHRTTIYRWTNQGRVEAVVAAGKRYISRSCLEEFLDPVSI